MYVNIGTLSHTLCLEVTFTKETISGRKLSQVVLILLVMNAEDHYLQKERLSGEIENIY